MLKDAGRTLTIPGGKDGGYGFVQDGVQYNFKGDGTVTAQQEDVATSPQAQQEWLARLENSINHVSGFLTDTSARRDALTAQRNALVAKVKPVPGA